MSVKPSDFFIGLAEFFAILLPGAIFTFYVWDRASPVLQGAVPATAPGPQSWIAFLIAAYVFGHVLHHAGGMLDPAYDKLYVKRWKRRKGEEKLLTKSKEIMRNALGNDAGQFTSTFRWAGSYVRVQNNVAAGELEKTGAESKFFRSFALILFLACIMYAVEGESSFAFGALVFALFAFWRFCRRRWDASQATYEYFVLLHSDGVRRGP